MIGSRSTPSTYEFFSQLNLSWLTSIFVARRGLRKNLTAGAFPQLTNRTYVRELRENNFRQLPSSWLTLLGFPVYEKLERARAQTQSEPHTEENDLTNFVLHG